MDLQLGLALRCPFVLIIASRVCTAVLGVIVIVQRRAVERVIWFAPGIPERVAMQMTGHQTRSGFERCNIVSVGELRDAAGGSIP